MKRRYCLTLDLKDDPTLIAEYKRYHEKIWPEITRSIKDSGIEDMEIYLLGTRMFMIMEVNESFSFEAKSKADQTQPKGAGVGDAHGDISEIVAASQARREMAADGTSIQVGRLEPLRPLRP